MDIVQKTAKLGLDSAKHGANQWWDKMCNRVELRSPAAAKMMRRLIVDSPVVLSFALVCVALHVLNPLVNSVGLFACPPWAQFYVASPLSYIRLVTHVLGHSGTDHLKGNLMHLLLVGPPCEREFGSEALAAIIIHVAIGSAFMHMAFAAPNVWQLGSSGVVFALILLNSLISARSGTVPLTFVVTVCIWVSNEVLSLATHDGVSHMAHLSGAAIGTYAGYRIHAQRE